MKMRIPKIKLPKIKLPKFIDSLATSTKYLGAGALVLVVGTFIVWKVANLVSPDSGSVTQNGATVQLQSTNYSDALGQVPLQNNLTDNGPTDQPYYGNTATIATPLTINSGTTINLPRFQIRLSYQ